MIFISSDHGGFELKNKLVEYFKNSEHELSDLGPLTLDQDDDYPDYAFKLCDEVLKDEKNLGILICRSGIGMCIAANKVKGINAAQCFNSKHAEMARRHNNANVLCLDADYEDFEVHVEIIKSFLANQFEGWDTRHG